MANFESQEINTLIKLGFDAGYDKGMCDLREKMKKKARQGDKVIISLSDLNDLVDELKKN